MIKITGRSQTDAIFSASWKSPSLVPPSPVKARDALCSFFSLYARATPSAIASWGPRWEIIPQIWCSLFPKWKLLSLPLLYPSLLPCHCINNLWSGIFREVKTPRFLCSGMIHSSCCMANVAPTAIASCPIPLNHFEIFPWRSRSNIFSSIIRGQRRER